MPKRGRVYVNVSVSFPPDQLAAAKKRADNLGLSFSTYIQKIVETDLQKRAPIIFQEYVEPASLAVADSAKPAYEASKPQKGRR